MTKVHTETHTCACTSTCVLTCACATHTLALHTHLHAHTHAHICTHKNMEGYCYPIICHLNAWNSNPHLLVTPAQLMRPSTYVPTKLNQTHLCIGWICTTTKSASLYVTENVVHWLVVHTPLNMHANTCRDMNMDTHTCISLPPIYPAEVSLQPVDLRKFPVSAQD